MTSQQRTGPVSGRDDPRPGTWVVFRVCLLTALGLAALPFPILALPAGFLVWIGWLSLPELRPASRRVVGVAFALAGLAAAVGLVRFVIEHAVAGIVGGGQTATSRRAVSRLRELVFAQDLMRKNGFLDPDGDGVGSAGWIGELAGAVPLRGGQRLQIPVLNHEWRRSVETPAGPAVEAGGYLFIVCLPAPDGWTARLSDTVDDERAERQFLAYAWPAASRPGFGAIYSVDERERIQVGRTLDDVELPYIGPSRPPACDAALATGGVLRWELWENKAPRAHLPGSEP
jgi:hypothetical protein